MFIPHLMKEFPWIEGYQLAEKVGGGYEVRLMAEKELDESMTAPVEAAFRSKLGNDIPISFKQVTSLERSKSGKTLRIIQTTRM